MVPHEVTLAQIPPTAQNPTHDHLPLPSHHQKKELFQTMKVSSHNASEEQPTRVRLPLSMLPLSPRQRPTLAYMGMTNLTRKLQLLQKMVLQESMPGTYENAKMQDLWMP